MEMIEKKNPIPYWIGRYSEKFRLWYAKKYNGRWLWWHMGLIEYIRVEMHCYPEKYQTDDRALPIDDFLIPSSNVGTMIYYTGTSRQFRKFKSWLKKIAK